jgi:hypothetical protein
MTHNSLLITLLVAGATRGFATGGAGCCASKGFFQTWRTKDGKLLFCVFRAALRTTDFLISKDELLKIFTAALAFIFIYRHMLTL